MPIPLLVPVVAWFGAGLLGFRSGAKNLPAHQVVVPIPPPNPMGGPPVGTMTLQNLDLVADLSGSPAIGTKVPTTWTYQAGDHAGEGGGGELPLAWVSPDGNQAAVVFNVTSVPEATVGATYLARKKITAFT